MTYSVKEAFYTLQGEGSNAGRPAVFCRFAGCNLWSGLEGDRSKAICQFCDTDFFGTDGLGGGRFVNATSLAEHLAELWPETTMKRFVVLTGGEPLLQVDASLIDALHDDNFEIALETNGTIIAPEGIDWICVSPKAGTTPLIQQGDELKLVYPQHGISPEDLIDLNFKNFFLQPMDGPYLEENTREAVAYCLRNPTWRISIQQHKILNIR